MYYKEIAISLAAAWGLFYSYALYHNDFKLSFLIDRSIVIENKTPDQVFKYIIDKRNYPLGMVKGLYEIDPANAPTNSMIVGKTKFKVDLEKLGKTDVVLSHWSPKQYPYQFGWVGVMVHKYIFSGDHYFVVAEDLDKRNTKLVHREMITGLNTPVVRLWHEWTGYIEYYTTYLQDVKKYMAMM
ncbi:predicted protein [Naegleria gruberi]|uniref:Predicted protein n=1 Tax=Naegleria gruberi TaxID=5762 RepID=D2VMH1_NAEGR|nr:uncharacterized protein NAEGRDRAFT_70134 [Naegleria gruberi]EFC42058.1 predicted protein [Naegleria gruberi]|eukprot:XP_002674802.1 predicted protein [Naegleria gruberi strain NEG-M]